MLHLSHLRRFTRLGTAAVVLAVALAASAGTAVEPKETTADPPRPPAKVAPPAAAEPTAPTPQTTSPERSGLRVYIDPDTGRLTDRPTAEQRRVLSEAWLEREREQPPIDLVPFDLVGGGQGLFLDGTHMSATVVRVRPDGSFRFFCVGASAGAPAIPDRGAPPDGETPAPLR